MQKIMSAYKDKNCTPKIETTNNAFKIILPNINHASSAETSQSVTEQPAKKHADSSEQIVLDYLMENGTITRADVEEMLDIGTATAYRVLKHMLDGGVLAQSGKGKNTKYSIANKQKP